MALDTRLKRLSAINPRSPWRGLWPTPDGTVGQPDRQVTAFMYSGIAATTTQNVTVNVTGNALALSTGSLTITGSAVVSVVGNRITLGAGSVVAGVPVESDEAGGTSRKLGRRRKVIRFSDLDERERLEALSAIPVKPFTPLEQAAVNLGEADEEDQADDELILMALMKIFH